VSAAPIGAVFIWIGQFLSGRFRHPDIKFAVKFPLSKNPSGSLTIITPSDAIVGT
jgi:hypothetical protein